MSHAQKCGWKKTGGRCPGCPSLKPPLKFGQKFAYCQTVHVSFKVVTHDGLMLFCRDCSASFKAVAAHVMVFNF